MNKEDFLHALQDRLTGLPQADIQKTLDYYAESIDDRVEDGASEEQAVSALGSLDDIVSQTLDGVPLTALVKEAVRKKRAPGALEIVLLILGSPIWLSVVIALLAVVLALYVSLWAVLLSLAACALALVAGGIFGIVEAVLCFATVRPLQGVLLLSCALICLGLSVFLGALTVLAVKGTLRLTKAILRKTKSLFVRKEEAK